jgi:hypothetical protein
MPRHLKWEEIRPGVSIPVVREVPKDYKRKHKRKKGE